MGAKRTYVGVDPNDPLQQQVIEHGGLAYLGEASAGFMAAMKGHSQKLQRLIEKMLERTRPRNASAILCAAEGPAPRVARALERLHLH
jgi:hypothetical protein